MIPVGADQLAGSLKTRLSDITQGAYDALSTKPERVYLVAPGQTVAWDGGCDGQLWSRVTTVAPATGSTPARRHGSDPCAVPYFVVTVELGIIRCAAVTGNNGKPPKPSQIISDGYQSINDMAELLGSLRCRGDLRSLTGWTPTGPEGGYHGGYWTFTIIADNVLGCEPSDSAPTPDPGA